MKYLSVNWSKIVACHAYLLCIEASKQDQTRRMTMSADWVSAIAGILAALFSAVAVAVAVWVSRQSVKQAEAIASEQSRREVQAYYAERKAEFREQCRAILSTANTLQTLLSPRVSELLADSSTPVDSETMRTVRTYLAQLSAETCLLTTFRDDANGIPEAEAQTVREFLEEAAWLYADSLHLAILVMDPSDEEDVDLRNSQMVIDTLLNGSSVNLEPRLMPSYNPESLQYDFSDWDNAWTRRDKLLKEAGIVTGQPLPDSLAEVAARSLGWVSIRRFADLTDRLLSSWGAGDAK